MGELLANMHIAHIDLIIKGNYELKNQNVNGLFLHHASGASLFNMKLEPENDNNENGITCLSLEASEFSQQQLLVRVVFGTSAIG